MARQEGTFKLTSNIEPRVNAPLDARAVVPEKADLYNISHYYVGMLVALETGGVYQLKQAPPTEEANWILVGNNGGSSNGSAHRELTQAEYDALTDTEKNNGTVYFITDGNTLNSTTPIDATLSSTSENPVQNKAIKAALDAKVDTSSLENYYTKSETDQKVSEAGGSGSGTIPTLQEVYDNSPKEAGWVNLKTGESADTGFVINTEDDTHGAVHTYTLLQPYGLYISLAYPWAYAVAKFDASGFDYRLEDEDHNALGTLHFGMHEMSNLPLVTITGAYVDLIKQALGITDSPSITIDSALSDTSENPLQNKAIKAALDAKANQSSLSAVATSGSYNDLSNKPTIPAAYDDSALTQRVTVLESLVEDLSTALVGMEYLESHEVPSNNQYIDTGIYATPDTRLILDFQLLSSDSGLRIAGDQSETGNKFRIGTYQGTDWLIRYNNQLDFRKTIPDAERLARKTIELGRGKFIVNGEVLKDFGAQTFTTDPTNTILLFAINDANLVDNAHMRLYSCKIYQGETLVRDFVPARHKLSTVTIGLYDKVDNEIYLNRGTGSFIPGPDTSERW